MKYLSKFIAATCLCASWTNAAPREDLALFRNGEKLVWDSTGHDKSKGVRMKISYPRTWKAAEGNRPNIVQKFTSFTEGELAMVAIVTRALPRELTLIEKQEIVSPDAAKDFIPEDSRLVSHKTTKIDGEECAMIEAEYVRESVGVEVAQKSLTFVIPRRDVILMIQCTTCGNASKGLDATRKRYVEDKPLFMVISSSCVLTDKWKTP